MAGELTLTSPQTQRRGRGRPKGSGNRRSADLARYIEAAYGGQTPGQQSAAVCLVTPGDLKKAKALARELQIPIDGLSGVMVALVVKARQLAKALDCKYAEAWVLMAKERVDLMAYIHQKLPPKADPSDAAALPQVFLIPGEAPPQAAYDAMGEDQAAIELIEDFQPA